MEQRERDRRERLLLFSNSENVVNKTLHAEWLGSEFENHGNAEREIDSIRFFGCVARET